MQPRKTDLARQVLSVRDGRLSLRERRALILCDGQRGMDELDALLGAETPALLRRLLDAGYLSVAVDAPTPPADRPPPDGPMRRRSLVAAKLYLLDMLELQRHPEAIRHRSRLQAAQGDEETLAQLLAALHCLRLTASPTLALRVRERLAEVLPEAHLPALRRTSRPTAAA